MIFLFVALGIVVFGFLIALFFAFLPSGALGHLERQVTGKEFAGKQGAGGSPQGGSIDASLTTSPVVTEAASEEPATQGGSSIGD